MDRLEEPMSSRPIGCQRAIKLEMQRIRGISLTPIESDLLDAHIDSCNKCRLERDLWQSVSDDPTGSLPGADELAEQRTIRAVMAAMQDKHAARSQPSPKFSSNRSRRLFILGGAAAAITAVGAVALLIMGVPQKNPRTSINSIARSNVTKLTKPHVSLIRGDAFVGEQAAKLGRPFEYGQWAVTGIGRIVIDVKTGFRLDVGIHTKIRLVQKADGHRKQTIEADIQKGHLIAVLDPMRVGPGFDVKTPKGRVIVTGTMFEVQIDKSQTEVRVLKGEVSLDEGHKKKRRVRRGRGASLSTSKSWQLVHEELLALKKRIERTKRLKDVPLDMLVKDTPKWVDRAQKTQQDRTRKTEKHTASQWFEKAQKFSKAEKWQLAAQAYQELIKRFPASNVSRTSRVSLGYLQLQKLSTPKSALRSFNDYLNDPGSGSLTEEALYGKALALKALGQTTSEVRVLKILIKRFPLSFQAPAARKRLELLRNMEPK